MKDKKTHPDPIKSDKMVHYCKDCREIVEVKQVGGKYVYTCKKCGTKNVAFGSENSIRTFYHVKEEEAAK